MSDPNMDEAAIMAEDFEPSGAPGTPESDTNLGSTTPGDQRPTGSDDPASDDDERPLDPITGDSLGE